MFVYIPKVTQKKNAQRFNLAKQLNWNNCTDWLWRRTHSLARPYEMIFSKWQNARREVKTNYTRAFPRRASTKHMHLLQTLTIDCLRSTRTMVSSRFRLFLWKHFIVSKTGFERSYVVRAIAVSLDDELMPFRSHSFALYAFGGSVLLFPSPSLSALTYRLLIAVAAFSSLLGRLKQMLRLNVGIK